MSFIRLRTVSAVDDKRIVLSNSQFARPIPFGTTWNKIRIGVRLDCTTSGGNLTGTPRFAVGLCSGNTDLYGDATTTHFVGVRTNEATWTLTNSNRYLVNGSTLSPHKKVGTIFTAGTAFFPGVQWGIGAGAATPVADRTQFILEITKGSPNFTLQMLGWINPGGVAAPVDNSDVAFYTNMEGAGNPAATNHTFSAANTLAVDEGVSGSFDHINIFWDRTTSEIELSDLAVARIS